MLTAAHYRTLQISLHFILSFSHESYGQTVSLDNLKKQWSAGTGSSGPPYKAGVPSEYIVPNNHSIPDRKANATFVILGIISRSSWFLVISLNSSVARNTDLNGVLSSMKQMEDRFNKKFRYPYTLLNEQPFTPDFKAYVFLGLISLAPDLSLSLPQSCPGNH